MTQTHHNFSEKPSAIAARSLYSLGLVIAALLAMCSIALAQAVKPETAHLKMPTTYSKLRKKTASLPEDVFFNAQARQVSAPNVLAANQMSATSIGSVLSLLFDSARVSLQTESDPLTATWTGTVTVPINAAARQRPKTYSQDIRGSLNKTADSQVTIFFNLGGKSFVVEFPYGTKRNGDIMRRFVSPIRRGSAGPYTASITIFAERRNARSALLVDIDGIDIEAR